LLWTEGTWEFDSRSQLSEEVPFKLSWEPLVLDAGRRIPTDFAASRLSNAAEVLSPVANPTERNDLQPTEVFLLSRLDQPTSISDLTLLSGIPEDETLRLIYALALSGLIQRQDWKQAIQSVAPSKPAPAPAAPVPPPEAPALTAESEAESLQRFLERLDGASTHYQVLAVGPNATTADIKKSYYEVARRYHPDRFRKEGDAALNARIEAGFARVTQAYETLRDPGPRATYDSKLDAQRRAQSPVQSAKTTSAAPPPPPGKSSESVRSPNEPLTDADRAEEHFKEGFAAKQTGQINTAIGMFSAAARLAPNDARYRAYYGQALATNAGTRRLAEAELQVAVKLDPDNGDYRTMLAELYRDLGFAVRARSELEKVLKVAPNNQKARELLRSL
jgi:tetratricopeptide (TPR) repeat protein